MSALALVSAFATGILASGALAQEAQFLLRPDPWSPWAAEWRAGAGGEPTSAIPRAESYAWEVHARESSRGQELVGQGEWVLDGGVLLAMQVAGSSRDDAQRTLGSTRRRGGWTGRVTQGLVGWRAGAFQLDFGRGWLSHEEDRLSELAISRMMPPVDLIRWSVHTRNRALELETQAGRLLSYEAHGSFRRWLAQHRLTWRTGGPLERVAVSDLLIYTGPSRGMDLATLAPFTPYFLRTFEGGSMGTLTQAGADSTLLADSENNMILLDWSLRLLETASWRLRQDGELLVDEFQIDGVDRRRLDDVLGLSLGFEAERSGASGSRLRGRLEHSVASRWLYIHPGRETNWVDRGLWIGNQEGGDGRESEARIQWMSSARGGPVLLRRALLETSLAYRERGETAINDDWDAEATKGGTFPSGVVERTLAADLCWRTGPLALRGGLGLTLDGGVGWNRRANADHEQGKRRETVDAWLRASLRLAGAGGQP